MSAQQSTQIGKNEAERVPASKDSRNASPNRGENSDAPRNGDMVPWPLETK
jgi:hypothetical protein